MNRLDGRICAIQSNGRLSLVDVRVGDDMYTATLLETPETAPYLKVGGQVRLLFKETEVSLAKGLSGMLSLRNRIPATVRAIECGDIMSAVELDYRGQTLTSVITSRAAERMQLAVGDQVEGLVKANEMLIMDVDHDD